MSAGRRRCAMLLALGVAVAITVSAPAATTEIEIDERAGDIISEIATVVGEFRLTDLPAELRIRARAMKFDYESGVLAYTGDVRVRHADVRLSADRLTFAFSPGRAQTLESVRANGNVTVIRGDDTARGDSAVYDPGGAIIRLSGQARLGSDTNTLSGESVVVYLDQRRAVVEGGDSRVRAVINPGAIEDLEEEGIFD